MESKVLLARHKHTTLTLQYMCASRRGYLGLAQRASINEEWVELHQTAGDVP